MEKASSSSKKRKIDEADAVGLGIDGLTSLSNQHFTVSQLAAALEERHQARIRLLKLDNRVESILADLGDLPAARTLAETMDKEYHRCLDSHRKLQKKAGAPLKKKKSSAASSLQDQEMSVVPEEQADL